MQVIPTLELLTVSPFLCSPNQLCSLQLDWSLEHPFELRIDNPLYSPLLGSRAIWSVLGLNDTYDILRVNVSTNQTDPAVGLCILCVSLQAVPISKRFGLRLPVHQAA